MAKKARFFEVTLKNIHDQIWTEIYAFQKGESLEKALGSESVKVMNVRYLDFYQVSAVQDEYDNVQFCAQINGEWIFIKEGQLGFDYLKLLFPNKMEEINEQIYHSNNPDY